MNAMLDPRMAAAKTQPLLFAVCEGHFSSETTVLSHGAGAKLSSFSSWQRCFYDIFYGVP
jgi:hypothetical protein